MSKTTISYYFDWGHVLWGHVYQRVLVTVLNSNLKMGIFERDFPVRIFFCVLVAQQKIGGLEAVRKANIEQLKEEI